MIWWIVVLAVWVGLMVLAMALCKASGNADRKIEEMFRQAEISMKKCIDCGGKMFKQPLEYVAHWGEDEVVINTECFVCDECGEKVFDYKEAGWIQKIAREASEGREEY